MTNLLTVLDDIATALDDISVMSKMALKKTSVLMSDDLAVNAGVVVGVKPNRELAIVYAIFLGALLNKVYCIAGIMALTAIYEPLIQIILCVGGIYLSFEGAHKIMEKLGLLKKHKSKKKETTEKQKITGAIITDFILSIEIIVIAKSSIDGSMWSELVALSVVGIAASIIIYGLVALIVKIDDFGLYLITKGQQKVGMMFVRSMPYVMKGLGIIGTIAMLLVGGDIISHIFHFPQYIPVLAQNLLVGLLVGVATVPIISISGHFLKKGNAPTA